ncbi:MAG: hypothetical protein OER93_05055, partial [Thermoleophilia bacterium]|nr:hypothetical protein [Thermoleophilia bacterium]
MNHERRGGDDAQELRVVRSVAHDPFAAHISAPEEQRNEILWAEPDEPRSPELDDPISDGIDGVEIVIEAGGPEPPTMADSEPESIEPVSSDPLPTGGARFVVPGDGIADDRAPDPVIAGVRDHPELAAAEDDPSADLDSEPESPEDGDRSSVPERTSPPGAASLSASANGNGANGSNGHDANGESSSDGGAPHLPIPNPALVAEVIGATGLMAADRLADATALAGTGSLAKAITETVGGPEEVAKA